MNHVQNRFVPTHAMKKLIPFLLLLATSLPGFAAEDPVATVRELDAARQRALVESDLVALQKIFDPQCAYTHASGRLQSGEDYLAALTRGDVSYLAMRYEFPPSIVLQGDRTAVVTGRVQLTARAPGGSKNERILATTAVYARQEGGWKLVSYQSTTAPAAPVPHILSRHVAVSNVCAWPKLTLLPDGTLIAALYDQPSHGLLPGDVACWASTDGGVTWTYRGNATRHVGKSAWFNHALGIARNGDLLVATSGWNYEADGKKSNIPLPPIVTRSSDGGRIWRKIADLPPSPEAGEALIPFGNIERGDDGSLRVAAYSFGRGTPGPRQDTGHVIASRDDGATWTLDPEMGRPEINETDLLSLGKGQWLAAARNLAAPNGRSAHSIDIHLSVDDGRTWTRHAEVTAPNAHPGDLLKLSDGRILLTYGDRRPPSFGVNAMISRDSGRTWSPEFRIVDGIASRDSGYPSSVQLADGTIVTAYYANGSTLQDGYQMSVVRWRIE